MFADQTDKNIGRPDMEPSSITGKRRYCNHTYRAEDCDKVVELMTKGWSINMVARDLDISLDSFTDWRKDIPEFAHAVSVGIAASQAFYEEKALEHLVIVQEKDGPKVTFNQKNYEFTMKSRFKVTDSLPPITLNVDSGVSDERLEELVKKIHKETI